MSRYRNAAPIVAVVALIGVAACGINSTGDTGSADFAALQARGEVAMGVDQYASTHVFDALPDGGRIEYLYHGDDADGVDLIRRHLKEIQSAFAAGDFSTPAFIHDRAVPGTEMMAARRDQIDDLYADLPRGAELRLVTADPEALAAIREFMAFQRVDHQAQGMDHTQADMEIVHELVTNNRAITRTVEHLPNGIRTVTESSSPAIAGYIHAHVASMEERLAAGEVFNLFSHTLPVIFDNWDRIESECAYSDRGATVVQTSDDPALVQALKAHAAEVTELVDEGMIAMMRGMMEGRMEGTVREGMPGGGPIHELPAP